MSFKTPKFWYEDKSLSATILSPISAIYGLLSGKRMRKRAEYASTAKVICIGNLTAGGSGKTPTAIALKQLLGRSDSVYLSRGYGGQVKGPELVSMEHKANDVGDEPLLLAQKAPTIVSQDRIAGAKLAEAHQAKVIIMDDGLQNPKLFKDIRICVIDGPRGFGNMQCMPSGPLRQPLVMGLMEVDAFIIIGEMHKLQSKLLPKNIPVFNADIIPDIAALPKDYKDATYIAFSGIAHPAKFEKSIEDIGIKLQTSKHFADHHEYTVKELKALYTYAKDNNCRLITTEKDMMRIGDGPWLEYIDVLPITLKFKTEQKLKTFLEDNLSGEL